MDLKTSTKPNINVQIFRYKFTDEIMQMLTNFAKLHRYDDRQTFKDYWKEWIEINKDAIDIETQRLVDLNYRGKVIDKMYIAARYYFRTKNIVEKDQEKKDQEKKDQEKKDQEKKDQEKKGQEKKGKRAYISLNHEFLEAIDLHIERNKNNENYSPANGYDDFYNSHIKLFKPEVDRICKEFPYLSSNICTIKFKKAYKNRYFQYTKF